MKGPLLILILFGVDFICVELKIKQAWFICVFIMGITLFKVWGENKPKKFMEKTWDHVLLPILFGHVGASLDLWKINPDTLKTSIILFISAEVFWFIGAYLTGFLGKYTHWERLFLAISWIPKGAKTVTLGFTLYPLVM